MRLKNATKFIMLFFRELKFIGFKKSFSHFYMSHHNNHSDLFAEVILALIKSSNSPICEGL